MLRIQVKINQFQYVGGAPYASVLLRADPTVCNTQTVGRSAVPTLRREYRSVVEADIPRASVARP